ncbi:MAG: hypothetical protein ACJ76S_07235 [Solirubrobacteraceae bacterium]|jgi:hypothetical protein
MRILPVLLVAMVVLFVTGLIAPRASKRVELWMDNRLDRLEAEGDRRAGFLGDWTAKLLAWGQRLLNAAVTIGRGLRGKLSGGS